MICNGVWGTHPSISKWISGFGHVWASNEPFLGTIILRLPSPMIEMCHPCWYPGRCNGKDINWRLFWATPVTLPWCCFFTRRYPLTRVVLWHDCIPSFIKKTKECRLLTWRCAGVPYSPIKFYPTVPTVKVPRKIRSVTRSVVTLSRKSKVFRSSALSLCGSARRVSKELPTWVVGTPS